MAQEEISFLKNLVHRLNHELSKYRGHNIDVQEDSEGTLPMNGVPAPWLTDKSLLSPLLAEYDAQMTELHELVDSYENEIKGKQVEMTRLVQENNRLSEKLKESLQSQLPDGETIDIEPLQGDEQVIQNLQTQVDTALQEKDAAIERWHETEQELDRLQQLLQEEKHGHQWGVIEQQAHQLQSEYFETVNILNRELEQVQQEFRQAKQELEIANHQVKDLRRTNKELEQQLNWKDQEVGEIIFKEGISDSKVVELKRIMDDLKKRLLSMEMEAEELKREKQVLEVRLSEMLKRIMDVGSREMAAVVQIRESVQMVEAAALEKEQAEVTLQQKEEELEQLREVINKLIVEAGARTRQEVDQVRSQSNDRIQKLTEELHALEMDNSEKQDMLEKAVRNRRAAEAELERVYKEGVQQMNKELGSFEHMNQRAINAERTRDDAHMLVETLQHKLKREEMNSKQLKEQLEGQLNNKRERMTSIQQEFEKINEDRMKLLDEVDEMKRKLHSALAEKEATQRKYQKEITIYEQENNVKIRDYELRLQSTEDVNRQSMTALRKLLTDQQRMSARWKEECMTVAQKYEGKLMDLRAEMTLLKKRNQEVTKLLKDSQDKTLQAEKMIQEYMRGIQRLEQRMRDSENRAADTSKQLSRHVLREKLMQSEHRSLTQEFVHNSLEASTKLLRSHPDDLQIGDIVVGTGSVRRKGAIDDFRR